VTIAREMPIAMMRIELKAATWTTESVAPGTVTFDNVRIARPPFGETAFLVDDFNGTAVDTTKWSMSVSGSQDPSILVTESGGYLTIGPLLSNNNTGPHYNGLVSNTLSTLRVATR
jgi:hypothetical protein